MVNSSQSKMASYRYDPFGNTISSSGTQASANVYRFSSKEIHVNTGIYYYGYRFYDPNLQRWLNRDPMGEVGGLNLYQAFLNSPFDTYDPLGEFPYLFLCPDLCPCTVNCTQSPGGSTSGRGSYSTIRLVTATQVYTCTDCLGNSWEETKSATRA